MKLKEGVSKAGAVLFGVAAGLIGGAVTGGATAAAQYVQANGATQDLKTVGYVAGAGAVLGVIAYFFPSPVEKK